MELDAFKARPQYNRYVESMVKLYDIPEGLLRNFIMAAYFAGQNDAFKEMMETKKER